MATVSTMPGTVLSVNVAEPRELEWLGRRAASSIWKEPVAGRVQVDELNLEGDRQADPRFHGGADKAAYAYAREDYDWWEVELGRSLVDATFGENLTLAGVDVTSAAVGERWAIGSAVLAVTGPRTPCWKLGARMESADFPVYFAAAGRPGAYLRVIAPGELGAGDRVEVINRPAHRLTVGEVAAIYHGDRARCEELLRAPEIGEEWRAWVRDRLAGGRAVLPG
jgi:MOSC domain-containing protein YiiM